MIRKEGATDHVYGWWSTARQLGSPEACSVGPPANRPLHREEVPTRGGRCLLVARYLRVLRFSQADRFFHGGVRSTWTGQVRSENNPLEVAYRETVPGQPLSLKVCRDLRVLGAQPPKDAKCREASKQSLRSFLRCFDGHRPYPRRLGLGGRAASCRRLSRLPGASAGSADGVGESDSPCWARGFDDR